MWGGWGLRGGFPSCSQALFICTGQLRLCTPHLEQGQLQGGGENQGACCGHCQGCWGCLPGENPMPTLYQPAPTPCQRSGLSRAPTWPNQYRPVHQMLGSTSSKNFLLNYKMPLERWYRRWLLEYIECRSTSVILAVLRNIRAIKGAQSTLLCSATPFPSNNKAFVM